MRWTTTQNRRQSHACMDTIASLPVPCEFCAQQQQKDLWRGRVEANPKRIQRNFVWTGRRSALLVDRPTMLHLQTGFKVAKPSNNTGRRQSTRKFVVSSVGRRVFSALMAALPQRPCKIYPALPVVVDLSRHRRPGIVHIYARRSSVRYFLSHAAALFQQ